MYIGSRYRETTAVTGTGDATVLGAYNASFFALSALLPVNGQTARYVILQQDGSQVEGGLLTRVSANVYSRDAYWGSNGTSNVNFTAGTKDIWIDTPGDLLYSLPVFGADFNLINGKLTASAAAGALTIAIKTNNGNDPSLIEPVRVCFGDATGTDGKYTVIDIVAATSFVLSSGSTLGVISSTAFRIWIVGFNDGGTFRLGAINCLANGYDIHPLYEGLNSSSAEGGAGGADTAGTIYTGTAVTSKPMRILGYLEWGTSGLTAGSWTTTNLSLIRHYGPGVPKPGDVVQHRYEPNNTGPQTGTTTIPFDNTTPQSTEGNEFMVFSITPRSPANVLRIAAKAHLACTSLGNMAMALFKDSDANALATSAIRLPVASTPVPLLLQHHMRAQSTSSITFRIRAGNSAAGTTTFNGTAGAEKYNSTFDSNMQLDELMA